MAFEIDPVTKLIRTALVNIGNPSTENEGINSLRGALRRMSATGFDPHNLVCVDFTKETLTTRLYEIIQKKDTLIAERDAEIRRLTSRVEALRRGRQEPRAAIDPIKFQTPISAADLGNEVDFGTRLRAAMDAAVEPVEPVAPVVQETQPKARRMRNRGKRPAPPERFMWNKENYLRAVNMYQTGAPLKAIAHEIGTSDGTVTGKLLNVAPVENYLGVITVLTDGSPMTYLELWKVGQFLFTESKKKSDIKDGRTWIGYIKQKLNLDPKRGLGGKVPNYLTSEQVLQLRKEYHKKAK